MYRKISDPDVWEKMKADMIRNYAGQDYIDAARLQKVMGAMDRRREYLGWLANAASAKMTYADAASIFTPGSKLTWDNFDKVKRT